MKRLVLNLVEVISFYLSFLTIRGGIRNLSENLGKLAHLRRLYHHCVNGGKLNDRDVGYINEYCGYYGVTTEFTGTKKSLSEVISEIERTHT